MGQPSDKEKQYPFIANIVGIVSIILVVMLLIAEILFLKFEIAIILSGILMITSMWAYRRSKTKVYEVLALICIINILILSCIMLRDSGIMPDINYKAVTLGE